MTGSYCRVVSGEGHGKRISLEEGAVTLGRGTEWALHGEACRIYFFFFNCF